MSIILILYVRDENLSHCVNQFALVKSHESVIFIVLFSVELFFCAYHPYLYSLYTYYLVNLRLVLVDYLV